MLRKLATICSSSTIKKTKCFIKHDYSIGIKPKRFATIYSENVYKFAGPVSIRIQQIHVSAPNKALHPLLIFLFRPITKLSAILFGRFLRKRWQKLTPEEKEEFWKKVKSKQAYIVMAGTSLLGFSYLYYIEHIQEDPITKRKKFIIFKDEQMKIIAQLEFENQVRQFRSDIVPISHPIYRRVARVANRILALNGDIAQIRNKNWGITVIDRPEITNAFVLPEGKIFVFSGMLNACSNDDQLAIVLSHEISHALCSHIAESMSRIIFLEMFLLIPSVMLWSIFPDVWAFISEWVTNYLSQIMFHLPFSRKLEMEADVVGLQLAAKACFDVREAPVLWAKMKLVNESPVPAEWLSTHPSHETRQIELRALVPKALRVREMSNCPLLGPLSKSSMYYGYST